MLVELTGEAAARASTVLPTTSLAQPAVGWQPKRRWAPHARRLPVTSMSSRHSSLRWSARGSRQRRSIGRPKAVNGSAYVVDNAATIEQLRLLPGVKNVHIIEQESPSISTSVPFIGAPAAWSGPQPLGVTGQNVRIGIIDTGIDYQHATFGGTGLLADYQANDRTVAPDAYFPNARVVGGKDFAGDGYTGPMRRCRTTTRWTATATART